MRKKRRATHVQRLMLWIRSSPSPLRARLIVLLFWFTLITRFQLTRQQTHTVIRKLANTEPDISLWSW